MTKLKLGITRVELERLRKGKRLNWIAYTEDEQKIEIEVESF